jgi:hypothetical protein
VFSWIYLEKAGAELQGGERRGQDLPPSLTPLPTEVLKAQLSATPTWLEEVIQVSSFEPLRGIYASCYHYPHRLCLLYSTHSNRWWNS